MGQIASRFVFLAHFVFILGEKLSIFSQIFSCRPILVPPENVWLTYFGATIEKAPMPFGVKSVQKAISSSFDCGKHFASFIVFLFCGGFLRPKKMKNSCRSTPQENQIHFQFLWNFGFCALAQYLTHPGQFQVGIFVIGRYSQSNYNAQKEIARTSLSHHPFVLFVRGEKTTLSILLLVVFW